MTGIFAVLFPDNNVHARVLHDGDVFVLALADRDTHILKGTDEGAETICGELTDGLHPTSG